METELDVLIIPDYRDVNPYQQRLQDALSERDVSVTTASGGGRGLPVLRAVRVHGVPDVIHVNFLDQYMILSESESWFDVFEYPVSVLLSLRFGFELLVLSALGTRVVWTAHDKWNHERRAIPVELVFKHLFVRYLFDEVIVHCDSAKAILADAYSLPEELTTEMTTIPHGHFLDDYPNVVTREEARASLDIATDDVVLLYFGFIREYKNVPLLIETFAQLQDDRARLLVVGNPKTASIERRVASLAAATDRVTAELEYVPNEDVQRYMNASDVVVLPFRTDGESLLTSGSVRLAMGFGNPVIASPVGCIRDLLDEEGGFRCDPSVGGSLLSAMEAAMDADLPAMSAHNREKVRQFSWDRIAAATHDVYVG